MSLDAARGIAMVLVVIFHLHLYLAPQLAEPPAMSAANDWLAMTRMPLLFLISGLLASGVRAAPFAKVARRIANTAWMFMVWAPAYMIACKLYAPLEMLASPRGEVWYLWALSIMTALLYATRMLDRRIVLAAVLCVSVPILYAWIVLPGYTQMYLGRYASFFFLGALFSVELRALLRPGALRNGAILMAATASAWWHNDLFRPIECLLLAMAALVVVRLACDRISRLPAAAAFVGRNTLPVYLIHGLVIRVLKHCLWVPVTSPLASALLILFTAPAIVVLCLVAGRRMQRGSLRIMFTAPPIDFPALADRLSAHVTEMGRSVSLTLNGAVTTGSGSVQPR